MQQAATHDELVETMTGGMVSAIEPFQGSDRLRSDGRPRGDLRNKLRLINDRRNAVTCLICLALPVAVITGVVLVGHWIAVVVAVPIIGVLQVRMFILSHEGAHRLLFTNRRLNDFIGITIFGWLAFGTGTHAYRKAHTSHHRDEFGPKEPDFLLYALYPITAASMRRKLRRDCSGVSAYRILRPRLTGLFRRQFLVNSLRFYVGQLFVFGLFAVSGNPFLYLVLWVLPYVTVYQILNRLRAIAEHGGMTRSGDRRDTAHHVKQSQVARAIIVPLGVGHHLAHHVDSGIPFRNLAQLTKLLEDDGYLTSDLTWSSYRRLWRALTTPNATSSARN